MLRGKVIKGLFLSSLSLGLFFGYASVSNNSNLNENVSAKTNGKTAVYDYVKSSNGSVKGWIWHSYLKAGKASNVKAKTTASLKRYKTGVFGIKGTSKLPAGVPYPTSPHQQKWAAKMNNQGVSQKEVTANAIKLNAWLRSTGKISSGSLHNNKGYIIPGKGQKVYRISNDDVSYKYVSTMSNGHKMMGQMTYQSYNLEFMPGVHSYNDNFTNPENGKNWVVYYISNDPSQRYLSKKPAGYKYVNEMPATLEQHFIENFANYESNAGSMAYNWDKKIMLVNSKAIFRSDM